MKLLFREQTGTLVFGDGPVHFQWRPGGNHIAVGGTSGLVRIYSRYGEVVEEFSINESVAFVKWDSEGELLAVVTTNSIAGGTTTSSAMVLYEFSPTMCTPLTFRLEPKLFQH
uniref:Anaphase-promoting complex subunit 4-like WD40 domain-containing protein n=1 Tax=Ditylenchus dipsaci TaxID=166011 RepID=A0A915DYB1_9BILA